MPEIAVFGEWNTSNLGDHAIHESVLRFCAGSGWSATSYALGSLTPVRPGRSARTDGGGRPGRWRAALEAAPRLKTALRGLRQRRRMRALLAPLEQADAILVGGGALLSDWSLHFPQSLDALAEAARRLGKPVYCLGCGVEGAWSAPAERKLRRFLDGCSLIAARDATSAGRIAQLMGREIPVFGDFCLDLSAAPNGGSGRPSLAINVQQLPPSSSEAQAQYEAALVDLAARLAAAGMRDAPSLQLFTTGSAEDEAAARRVHARLAGAQLVLPRSLEELHGILDAADAVLASRLHAGILALARGTAVLGFSAHDKLQRFFSTLGIGADVFGMEAADGLVQRLAAQAPAALAAGQRERLLRSPIWHCRDRVGGQLRMLSMQVARCS